MAGLKNADDFKSGERFKGAGLVALVALIVGLGASAIFFIVAFTSGEDISGQDYSRRDCMAFSWLFAVIFFLSLAVGGLFWTLLHHATNSGWGTVVRRLMENLGIMIPVVLLLSLPLVLEQFEFRNVLWEWFEERAEVVSKAEVLASEGKDEYRQELEAKANKAEEDLLKVKSAKAKVGDDISPGHARHFDDKIDSLASKVDKLKSHANMEEEVLLEELTEKHFKDGNALLYAKRNYLNEKFWLLRFVIYVAVLTGAIFMLRSLSVRQDLSGDPRLFTRMRGMSCLLLLPFAVSWTFLVFDWLMALDYSWFSTMWGVYLFAGAALNSMGLLILIMSWLRGKGYLANVVTREHYHIMGKLMHAFVIFWAYIAFSQFFLIWYANITEETKFFLMRNTGMWNGYTIAFLVIGHFFIPFIVLLIRSNKTTTWIVCTVAIWNLLMHVFDLYWIVIAERAPSLTHGATNWIKGVVIYDVLAFLGVGGIFIFVLLKVLGSASLFPCRDPRLDESLNLTN